MFEFCFPFFPFVFSFTSFLFSLFSSLLLPPAFFSCTTSGHEHHGESSSHRASLLQPTLPPRAPQQLHNLSPKSYRCFSSGLRLFQWTWSQSDVTNEFPLPYSRSWTLQIWNCRSIAQVIANSGEVLVNKRHCFLPPSALTKFYK
jgi:hypothetical protein